jgi:hypothetical protein
MLKLKEVVELTGLSRATIYRYEARGNFPPRRHEDVTINNYYLNGARPDESDESRFAREDTDDGSNVGTDFTTNDDEFV